MSGIVLNTLHKHFAVLTLWVRRLRHREIYNAQDCAARGRTWIPTPAIFRCLSRALLLIWKVSVPTTPIGLKWELCQKSSCRLYIALGALPSYTVWRKVKRLSDLPEDTQIGFRLRFPLSFLCHIARCFFQHCEWQLPIIKPGSHFFKAISAFHVAAFLFCPRSGISH